MNPVFDLMDYADVNPHSKYTVSNNEYVEEFDGFVAGAYNGIEIKMSKNKEWFRVNDLFNSLTKKVGNKAASTTVSKWVTRRVGATLLEDEEYGCCFVEIEGNQTVSGLYASIDMFDLILYSTNILKAKKWIDGGDDWREFGDKGEIYMVQSSAHVGTDTYKYGMSWRASERISAYGQHVHVIKTAKVLNRFKAEGILLKHAKQAFELAIRDANGNGNEYFTIKNIEEGKAVFDKALVEIRNKGM